MRPPPSGAPSTVVTGSTRDHLDPRVTRLIAFATGRAGMVDGLPNRGGARIAPRRGAAPRGGRWKIFLVEGARPCSSAKDGEGARKFVTVRVTGAVDDVSARRVAFSIANSPLVKTAIAGEDANWGRVVMAVGKAGEPADRDRLSISFGGVRVAHQGARDPDYSEEAASAVMREGGHRRRRRPRARRRGSAGVDLRPDQGLCRDQRDYRS